MAVTKSEIRSGAYYDSVILMQLQRALAGLPGVEDAGVIMGTDANKDILAQGDLLTPEAESAAADDMVVVVRARDEKTAQSALAQIDELLTRRRSAVEHEYLPKSLDSALSMLPDAGWVLVSVPGRYAAGVAREALDLDRNVFLYSDNVTLEDEVALKKTAREKGLLVMGPDCGTAIVNGIGLGFANQVRRGPIGMVAASGTGLQQVSSRIHQMGSGITHAIGTGGRDLSEDVQAITFLQGLDLLSRDPQTKVIVLVSKPPSPKVAQDILLQARRTTKPVVVDFIGFPTIIHQVDNLHFTTTFDETAALAVQLASSGKETDTVEDLELDRFKKGQRYLRGLFSGGTLAYEAQLILENYLPAVYSNAPLDKKYRLEDSLVSQAHTVIDLGEDEFTVGRLHPMMDNDLRIRRLHQEAEDPEVAVILLDVVLGYGAHPDPAGELAPAIEEVKKKAKKAGRHLEFVAVVTGTDEDPQGLEGQVEKLQAVGVRVETSNDLAVRHAGRIAGALNPPESQAQQETAKAVDLSLITQPLAAVNVGLESFAESLESQGAAVVQVDWKPPAGGNEELIDILARMKKHE
ncbi:MAG: acyl-CoA synthetase FdrA [Anaerolineales bacterium]